MPSPTEEPDEISKLRVDAEGMLKEGSAPPTKGWPTGASALILLHKLASEPASASDALKVLHELQVHQVELDLQHEQMENTQHELAEELVHYKGLFEFAPLGYFRVGPKGNIIEGNLSGAALFGVDQVELTGRSMDSFLAPESRPVLLELLKRLRGGGSKETCEVQSRGENVRRLEVVASAAPGDGSFLLVVIDTTDRRLPA